MNEQLFYVIVRFEVKQDQFPELTSLIKIFFEKEVSSFPGFISFKLHANYEETVLINYATWQSSKHFQKFKAFAATSALSKEIQAFSPRADGVCEISSWSTSLD